ncbi:MAG: NAD-dependent DNA ligase LigA, partial [Phycisphaerae bacterium]|nr:NAD-dependent DNA ligase LigA [Phycisphaerae bacterium]
MSKAAGVSTRVRELRRVLARADRAYYAEARPIMSDREYDDLLKELAALEAAHPELDDPSSPTKRVGAEAVSAFTSAEHAVPMLSIDNTYKLDEAEDSLAAWQQRTLRALEVSRVELVADAKIDGVAMSLRYEGGKLVRALTRGDGTRGDDVTHNVRTIRSVPLVLEGDGVPDVLEIRGEVYVPLKEFERVNAEREAEGEELFANPRNAAAGT